LIRSVIPIAASSQLLLRHLSYCCVISAIAASSQLLLRHLNCCCVISRALFCLRLSYVWRNYQFCNEAVLYFFNTTVFKKWRKNLLSHV